MKRKRGKEEEFVRSSMAGHALFLFGVVCLVVSWVLVVIETSADMMWFIILLCLAAVTFFVVALGHSTKRHDLFSVVICLLGILTCLRGLVFIHGVEPFSGKTMFALLLFCVGIISAWRGRWIVSKNMPPFPFPRSQPNGKNTPPKENDEQMVRRNLGAMGASSVIPLGGFTLPFKDFLYRLLYFLWLVFCIICGTSVTFLRWLVASVRAAEKGSLAHECFIISLISLIIAVLLWLVGDLTIPLVRLTLPLILVTLSVVIFVFGLKAAKRSF
jgi:hypothetical protein